MKHILRLIVVLIIIGVVMLIVYSNDDKEEIPLQSTEDTAATLQSAEEEKPITKEEYLQYASMTLSAYSKEQRELLENEIIPMICCQVAEKFSGDYEKILKDYTGMGGIKIKPSYEDFRKAWEANFNFYDYRNLIDRYLNVYNNTLKDFYADFCKSLEVNNISTSSPSCFTHFDLPKGQIENYVDTEMKQFYCDMADYAVDGLLILAEVATVGMTTPLLVAKWAKTGYDVSATVDELLLDDSTEESEKLEISIAESLMLTIENYLINEYDKFFSAANSQVYNNIKNK